MAKKSKTSRKISSRHEINAKAIIGLLVVVLSFLIFYMFFANQDYLISSGNLTNYLLLAILGSGLLVGLFYLVSNSKN